MHQLWRSFSHPVFHSTLLSFLFCACGAEPGLLDQGAPFLEEEQSQSSRVDKSPKRNNRPGQQYIHCYPTNGPVCEEPVPECDDGYSPQLVDQCFGECVPQEQCLVSCDTSQIFCDSLPPECLDSAQASVVDGCWGPCVPVAQCAEVPPPAPVEYFKCDAASVPNLCEMLPEPCDDGFSRAIEGTCYGECVPQEQCLVSCDISALVCDAVAPDCLDSQRPLVFEGCPTGECVDVARCFEEIHVSD